MYYDCSENAPGASDAEIENQATDLMYLPSNAIEATIERQEKVAKELAMQENIEISEEKKKAIILKSRYDIAREQWK